MKWKELSIELDAKSVKHSIATDVCAEVILGIKICRYEVNQALIKGISDTLGDFSKGNQRAEVYVTAVNCPICLLLKQIMLIDLAPLGEFTGCSIPLF